MGPTAATQLMWTVDSGQWTVDSGQWTVAGSGLYLLLVPPRPSASLSPQDSVDEALAV